MRRFTAVAVVALAAVAACGNMSAPPGALPDLGRCGVPPVDGGATSCASSTDCPRGNACVAKTCQPIGACSDDCACKSGSSCDAAQQRCVPHGDGNLLCGRCDDACTKAGGKCRDGGCATPCDDKKTYCPRGYRCDIAASGSAGNCVPALTTGCSGCGSDDDCPRGELCNVNNRRCVRVTSQPDARLQMTTIDFLFDDGTNPPQRARNILSTIGFYTYHDPSFDPFAFGTDTCGSQRSTADENAPFPLGPMGDAGATLTLALPGKTVAWTRSQDGNPAFGYSYRPTGLMVADLVPGRATWSAPGGFDVGAFAVAGTIPKDFTSTPDLVTATPLRGNFTDGISVAFAPAAEAYIGSWLEVSWNEVSGNTVLSLNRIYCRSRDNSPTVTIPGSLLMSAGAPSNTQLTLIASRASVGGFVTGGVIHGRMVFGVQKIGTVVLQ